MKILSKSIDETKIFAEEVLGDISKIDREPGKASVVLLYGDLGSGKTTFSQIMGKLLGVKEKMQSPTFVIMKSYKLKAKSYKLLVHIDAYRLEKDEEILPLGFKDLLGDGQNLILIEWPEKIKKFLPKEKHEIYFKFVDEDSREMTFSLNK